MTESDAAKYVVFDPDASSDPVVRRALRKWNAGSHYGIQAAWDSLTINGMTRADFSQEGCRAVLREALRQLLLMLPSGDTLRMNQDSASWSVCLEYMRTMKAKGEPSRMMIPIRCVWYAAHFCCDPDEFSEMIALADDKELNAQLPSESKDTLITNTLEKLSIVPRRVWPYEKYIRAILQRANLDGSGVCIIGPQYRGADGKTSTSVVEYAQGLLKHNEGAMALARSTLTQASITHKEELVRRQQLLPIIVGEIQERERQIRNYCTTLPTLLHSILGSLPSFARPLVELCHGYLDYVSARAI